MASMWIDVASMWIDVASMWIDVASMGSTWNRCVSMVASVWHQYGIDVDRCGIDVDRRSIDVDRAASIMWIDVASMWIDGGPKMKNQKRGKFDGTNVK